MAGDTEFFSLYEEELGGTRPDRLFEVRPQDRVPRRTVEQIVDNTFIVASLDVPVPQMVCRQLDTHIPEQAIEVPKTSSSSRHSRRRRVRFAQQTAEQLVEVPTIISHSSLHGLRGLVEQTIDIPAPHGRGRVEGGGLHGLHPGQSFSAFGEAEHRFPAATAEQIVDIPVPRGGLQDLRPGQSSASSSHSPADLADDALQGVFRTFHRWKKCAAELGADFTSSTPVAELEGFFTDATGVWMQFPDGRWKLPGSDPEVWWPG